MKKKRTEGKKSSGQSKVVTEKKSRRAIKKPASLQELALKNDNGGQLPSLWSFTLQVIYKNLYILGILLMRRRRHYARKAAKFLKRMQGTSYARLEMLSISLSNIWKNIVRRLKAPFLSVSKARDAARPEIVKAREEGRIPLRAYWHIAGVILSLVYTVLSTLFNYLAPVAAAWLLVYTINAYVTQPIGLAVEYNGQIIGYVNNETEYEEAAQTLKERFIGTDMVNLVKTPRFTLVGMTPEGEEPRDKLAQRLVLTEVVRGGFSKVSDLADKMVQTSGSDIEQAYGFYVNNRFYGAVTDLNFITSQLEDIQQSSLKGKLDEKIEFTKRISVREGLYPLNSIVTTTELYEQMHSYDTVEQTYVVKEGDNPLLISNRTGLSIEELSRLNGGDINAKMQIGEEVLTEVAQPFLSVKNIYTTVEEEEFEADVVEVETVTYAKGYREVTQEGIPGVREITSRVTEINGVETDREPISTVTLQAAVPEKAIVGTNIPQVTPTYPGGYGSGGVTPGTDMTSSGASSVGGFIWPTAGGRITVYVGGYAGHTGVDIPRNAGTPIYAAASGTVVLAKNTYTGYGRHIIIDHGNGTQTLYAHATQLFVSVGDQVSQGQVIASVGRTGWATGNHLHFEVRQNGRTMQPQNYIGHSG